MTSHPVFIHHFHPFGIVDLLKLCHFCCGKTWTSVLVHCGVHYKTHWQLFIKGTNINDSSIIRLRKKYSECIQGRTSWKERSWEMWDYLGRFLEKVPLTWTCPPLVGYVHFHPVHNGRGILWEGLGCNNSYDHLQIFCPSHSLQVQRLDTSHQKEQCAVPLAW